MKSGQRPSAVICRTPYAGHEKWWDPYWIPDPILDTAWTDWDYLLLEVYQAIDAYTSGASGQPRWIAEDPDVYWDTEIRVDFADAKVKQVSESMKSIPDGGIIYPVNPQKRNNEPFWTIKEWLESYSKEQPLEQGGPVGRGHAPTPADLKKMRERKKQKDTQ